MATYCAIQIPHIIFKAPVVAKSSNPKFRTFFGGFKIKPDAKGVDEAVAWVEGVKADELVPVDCFPVRPPSSSHSLQSLANTL